MFSRVYQSAFSYSNKNKYLATTYEKLLFCSIVLEVPFVPFQYWCFRASSKALLTVGSTMSQCYSIYREEMEVKKSESHSPPWAQAFGNITSYGHIS